MDFRRDAKKYASGKYNNELIEKLMSLPCLYSFQDAESQSVGLTSTEFDVQRIPLDLFLFYTTFGLAEKRLSIIEQSFDIVQWTNISDAFLYVQNLIKSKEIEAVGFDFFGFDSGEQEGIVLDGVAIDGLCAIMGANSL